MEIANKVGAAEIASRVVEDLKDENEQFRKMVMDCIEKVSPISIRYALNLIVQASIQLGLYSSVYQPLSQQMRLPS